MHNSYYFLKQVSDALSPVLKDAVISECFSQSKAELIFRFETHRSSFLVKASLLPAMSALSFPPEFHRAKKNSIDLFDILIGRRVLQVRSFNNERCIAIDLSDSYTILFKMHGNRANVIIFENSKVLDVFRSSIEPDWLIDLNKLDRTIDWSHEAFVANANSLPSLYFTFGKVIWQYLHERGFSNLNLDQQWQEIVELKKKLDQNEFFICDAPMGIRLLLFPWGKVLKTTTDPLIGATEYFHVFAQLTSFRQEKTQLTAALHQQLQSSIRYVEKSNEKLESLEKENNYKEWADLIMANLHKITPSMDRVVVENFYDDNIAVEIKLKQNITPQKNAEIFYRKSKNQQIELDHILKAIQSKEEEIDNLRKYIAAVGDATDIKSIQKIKSETKPLSDKQATPLPYHEVILDGFKIWIGKNAQSNDELTLKRSFKEDLWLHAKDVSGSHVLIKHQSGKTFPKHVIERAAQLAAYYSKRKSDSLCPVIVTPKKFVRKRKGDPAGAVVVDREEVILVEPKN